MTGDGRTLLSLRDIPVIRLAAVSSKGAERLASLDPAIETVLDLVTHYPRRYLDRTAQARIADLETGAEAMVLARVRKGTARRTRQGRALVEMEVFDGSSYLQCTFFNQSWRLKQLPVGTEAVFFGRVETYRGRRRMTNPVVDLVGDRTGRIVPIYPQSEKAGLTTWDLAGMVAEAVRRAGRLVDPLDEAWRSELGVVERGRAISLIHAPGSMEEAAQARHRLALDELLRLQLTLVMRKRALERAGKGLRHRVEGPLVERFRANLAFDLTAAQEQALAEIAGDLAGPHPMHRLLQGDVGSGKTVVAVAALVMAVQGGHQGALMAPTEVLAEQHHQVVRRMLEGLEVAHGSDGSLFPDRPLRVELLTNRTGAAERARLQEALAAGQVDVLVGTHALLTGGVSFRSLGVAVIDEQHRFGVEQRAALRGKGDDPDVLVMTATPIPRTAAMTIYGDLDVSVIAGMPPGRTPVTTTWARTEEAESRAWAAVRSEVAAGHQAYVVCPLIEDSDRIEARSAEEELARLSAGPLEGLRLGLLHGRVPARDKDSTMSSFRDGSLDVLVATTVIEVGVDVPNATVMVIEGAERFGIAQLHQLRGRVGRGAAASRCILLGPGSTPAAEARLSAVERTADGFELAEVDLDLRGGGTILGTRQKGRSDLKLADLARDRELVAEARRVALEVTAADPSLSRLPLLAAEVRELVEPEEADFLFKS